MKKLDQALARSVIVVKKLENNMGAFLLGFIIGFLVGIFFLGYLIVDLNIENPDRFDQIIVDLRKKLEHIND